MFGPLSKKDEWKLILVLFILVVVCSPFWITKSVTSKARRSYEDPEARRWWIAAFVGLLTLGGLAVAILVTHTR